MARSNILFWVAILFSLLFFHTRGFISHDEGWILNAASRILDGEMPYRDFYFLYTPGSIFSVALWFKLFGNSILSARILAFLFSILSVFFLYKIIETVTNYKLLVLSSVFLFLVWGPFQINFVWMVMLSITSGLATVYFLQKSNQNSNFSYLAGISCALALLFKQNFGLAILIVALVAFAFNSELRAKIKIVNFIFGFIFVSGLFVIYLLTNNSFLIFFEQMRYLLFQKIITEGMLSSPFIYPDVFYKQILKLFFYVSPLILSVFAVLLSLKNEKKLTYLAAFPLSYYLLSIRPTTDLIHLAPLIAISGISLSLIYTFSKDTMVRFAAITILLVLIFLGAYIVVFRDYYRWEAPILSHNYLYKHPKINIFVDAKNREVLDLVIPELKKSKADYIFVYHFAPMFYFISGKKNPTYYDDLQPKLLTQVEQGRIISNLAESRVDTILANSDLEAERTALTKYILTNYYRYKTIHDYSIYKLTP